MGRLFPSTPQSIIDMPSFYPVFDYDRQITSKKYRILFYAKNDEQISFICHYVLELFPYRPFPDFLILSNYLHLVIHRLSKIPNLVVSRPLQHGPCNPISVSLSSDPLSRCSTLLTSNIRTSSGYARLCNTYL